ncbi:MAG: hypothetical protein JWQ43_3607 [Glaciihabitans sp.]|nr:hypothetical protein [Glaciihabitans sp.]
MPESPRGQRRAVLLPASWLVSPQRVDPLSWFTAPVIPLLLGVAAALQGVAASVTLWDRWSEPGLQLAAAPIFLVAGVLTGFATRPHRARLGLAWSFAILGVATLGVLVSAAGTVGGTVRVEHWWALVSLSMVQGALAPFSSARQLVINAVPLLAVVWVSATVAYPTGDHPAYPLSIGLIAVTPILVSLVAGVVFTSTFVSRTWQLSDRDHHGQPLAALTAPPTDSTTDSTIAPLTTPASITSPIDGAGSEPRQEPYPQPDDVAGIPEANAVDRIGTDVVPFLEAIAERGTISAEDRLQAMHLAERVRGDLVSAANRSWLEDIAAESGLVVSDPGRRADRMGQPQRAALRGLLMVILDNPAVDPESLLIELRGQDNDSTAVALSLDVDLPEGRRLMMLAPYYLTLQTTVDNLTWADGRSSLFRFEIPADQGD